MNDAQGPLRGREPDVPRSFHCLWCGQTWRPGREADLEALAQLCPDCLGRADANPFTRFRLRAALEARAKADSRGTRPRLAGPTGAASVAGHPYEPDPPAAPPERGLASDDWYLRRGRYAQGQVQDLAWQADLDAATTWLDGLPIGGRVVELESGSGWWSPLLASKGELTAFDAAPRALDRVRERLVAHRLRAHLHARDPWDEPDQPADVLFTAFWLSRLPAPRLAPFLAIAGRWLEPGGLYAFIDAAVPAIPEMELGATPHALATLNAGLVRAGFTEISVTTTSRYFVLGSARARGDSRSFTPAGSR